MFGSIGFPEMMIILMIALLVFGPKKLPEVGKSLGKALREFRKTSDEIKEKIEEEIQAEEFREIKRDVEELTDIKSSIYPDFSPNLKEKKEKTSADSQENKDNKIQKEKSGNVEGKEDT